MQHPQTLAPANRDSDGWLSACVTLPAFICLLLASSAVHGAGSEPAPGTKSAVSFEAVPGTPLKRVILTAKAAERLGIETSAVREERIVHKQMFGGQVIHPFRIQMVQARPAGVFGGFTPISDEPAPRTVAKELPTPAAGETWISLALSQEEWDRVAQDKPARILPLATRGDLPGEVLARPSKFPPAVDVKRSMLTVYYVLPAGNHGLKMNDRIRIELQLKGRDESRRVVPYSALYYDDKGIPWVYVNTRPLTFERRRVEVERIEGDYVILKSGPDKGTQVVTVGAPLLYGAEVIYKY